MCVTIDSGFYVGWLPWEHNVTRTYRNTIATTAVMMGGKIVSHAGIKRRRWRERERERESLI